MTSTIQKPTPKERDLRGSEDSQTSSLLQHTDTAKRYAIQVLTHTGHGSQINLLEYESVIKMIEYLRHRNPDCDNTIITYMGFLNSTLKVLGSITPDDLVRIAREADEDQLEALFLRLDDHWLEELNATASRLSKWAALKTFLEASHVRKARLIKCNIRKRRKIIDYALTKDDCRRTLEAAKTTEEKLTVSLLIESMQRIGTITQLIWGDMKPHLDKGEDTFMVWIDPKRTKRNIEHWMPVGPLSSYHMRKRLSELGAEPTEEAKLTMITGEQVQHIMRKAGVIGKKQGSGNMTRYEKHVHSFRKFGVVEMQRVGVNEQVIRFLMGQKRDTYSEWSNRYDELLDIYREARPRLDQKQALEDVLEYAKARGYSLDPKDLHLIGVIRADQDPHRHDHQGVAEAEKRYLEGSKIEELNLIISADLSASKCPQTFFKGMNEA